MSFRRTLRLNRFLDRHLGGTNLEILKFGMYILFPISWMYYFGTNLDNRFSVPDFWPKKGETHTLPFEREELGRELQRLKERRLRLRDERLRREGREGAVDRAVGREVGAVREGEGKGENGRGGSVEK